MNLSMPSLLLLLGLVACDQYDRIPESVQADTAREMAQRSTSAAVQGRPPSAASAPAPSRPSFLDR